MYVSDISLIDMEEQVELSAIVNCESVADSFRIYYRVPKEFKKFISGYGDMFVPILLPVCSVLNEDLHIPLVLSTNLKRNTKQFIDIYKCWYKNTKTFNHVEIFDGDETISGSEPCSEKGNGVFFSLGVDSTYTLIKNISDINTLIIIDGFDAWMWEKEYLTDILNATQDTIKVLNTNKDIKVIPIETNFREFAERYLDWWQYMFGAGLASVALFLGNGLKECFISLGMSYNELYPRGSHPLLDPLWSTEYLKLIDEGGEYNRLQEVIEISKYPGALNNLRVCEKFNRHRFNCGYCNKCIRTMIELHISGRLNDCLTLPSKIPLEVLSSFNIEKSWERTIFMEILNSLTNSPEDVLIKRAIRKALKVKKDDSSKIVETPDSLMIVRNLIDDGHFKEAFDITIELIKINPFDPEINYLTGFCRLILNTEINEALVNFNKALEYGFDEFWVKYNRASVYEKLGMKSEAKNDILSAIKLNPTHEGAQKVLHQITDLI
jgi:tetratricopeptide (TPR) repeat protein